MERLFGEALCAGASACDTLSCRDADQRVGAVRLGPEAWWAQPTLPTLAARSAWRRRAARKVRPGGRRTHEEHRTGCYSLRQLAIGSESDGWRREGRLGQEFADGAGVRGVKHGPRMASTGAGRYLPAMLMPAVVVAMVTVALCAVVA